MLFLLKKPNLFSFFFLLFLAGCSFQLNPSLNYSYDYRDDGYLTFIYPGEHLPFNLTYRLIDYDYNLLQLASYGYMIPSFSQIQSQLQQFLAWAKQQDFSNTLVRGNSPNVALDTFCIIGYAFQDAEAASHAVAYLTPEFNWMDDHYYANADKWRNIADETWCVMLVKKTGVNDSLAERLLAIKLQEGNAILENQSNTLFDKAAVALHELLLLKEFDGYEEEKQFWVTQTLQFLADKEIQDNNLLVANLLDALLYYSLPQKQLQTIYQLLLQRKTKEGYWLPYQGAEPGYGHILTTQRVLIALAHWREKYAS